MRLAIIGIGAMGCLFAGRLAGLVDLIMLGEWPEQIAALRSGGLHIRHAGGGESRRMVAASDRPEDAGVVDLALILVKSYKSDGAAALARRILHPAGLALTLQNGLGNLEILQAGVGEARAALGVTSQGAAMVAPGYVQEGGSGHTYLAHQPWVPRLEGVAELFRQAGFSTTVLDDVDTVLWGKLAVNAAINPLTALLEVPNGYLAENEPARRLMVRAAEETATVAHALGIAIDGDSAGRALRVAQATAANRSSMLQDVERGAPTEIEAITGQIVATAHRLALAIPVNEALLLLVREKMAGRDWRLQLSALPRDLQPLFAAILTVEESQ
jgi:2-dehydropantoate 2-reductase